MKTTMNQEFVSLEELNRLTDEKMPFSHAYLRAKLLEKEAIEAGKGEAKIYVYTLKGKISAAFMVPLRTAGTKNWIYSPIVGTSYSREHLNKPFFKKHLPQNWKGEDGIYHQGEKVG